MRLPSLTLVLAVAGALLLPAAAPAKLTVGISENSPTMFGHPLFQSLEAKHVRVVVPYDVMTSGNHELPRITSYLAAAQAAGIQPLVTFEHSTGDASICAKRSNHRKAVCRIPSQAAYKRHVKLFLRAFPWVRAISPWNEINHFTQGTSRNPRAAAGFTNTVAKLCRGCTIVAADVLDQANRASTSRPSYAATINYIRKFRAALRVPRKVCGIHNYSDVNRFRSSGTKQLIRALGCKQIWLTETGGLYKFGSFWTKSTRKGCKNAEACQLKATKYMFGLARQNARIKRVYVYTFFGDRGARFDSGLVDERTGLPRKAYAEVAKRL